MSGPVSRARADLDAVNLAPAERREREAGVKHLAAQASAIGTNLANGAYARSQAAGSEALERLRAETERYRSITAALATADLTATDALTELKRIDFDAGHTDRLAETFTDAAATVETIDADPESYGDDLLDRYPALDLTAE